MVQASRLIAVVALTPLAVLFEGCNKGEGKPKRQDELYKAISNAELAMVKKLVDEEVVKKKKKADREIDVDAPFEGDGIPEEHEGHTPLTLAASKGSDADADIITALVDDGKADIKEKNKRKYARRPLEEYITSAKKEKYPSMMDSKTFYLIVMILTPDPE